MSKESALKFMVQVMKTPPLQQELRHFDAKDLPAIVKTAQREGFEPFTQDEYYFAAERAGGEWNRWAAKMRGEAVSEDLSDAELAQMAGGKGGSSLWSTGHSCCMISAMVGEPNWCDC